MSEVDNQVEAMEISLQQQKEILASMESLERLIANKDFEKIFTEGYFKNEACRLVQMRGEPAMTKPEDQEAILKAIDSIAGLRQYLRTIMQFGSMAKKAIMDTEEELEDTLAGIH